MNKLYISVVIPVYSCCNCLNELCNRLKDVLINISEDYEIILVNDGSPDFSWEVIQELATSDKKIKGINLARNFGQHYAITAGLDYATGDWVVVMDCDLQDQPEEIIKLYEEAQDKYDVVFGKRYNRKDNFFRKIGSKFFYMVFNYFTNTKLNNQLSNFSISKKIVIDNFKKLTENHRFFPIFIFWLGFKIGYVNVEHSKRNQGKSSYSFRKLLNIALDSIFYHSDKPLKIITTFGLIISLLSLIAAFYFIINRLFFGVPVQGWTSLMVSLWFIAGLVFSFIGIIGLYIGNIFKETKKRPLYIIKELIGINN